MRVTEGVRKIIVEWHGKGVPPEKPAGIGDNRRES